VNPLAQMAKDASLKNNMGIVVLVETKDSTKFLHKLTEYAMADSESARTSTMTIPQDLLFLGCVVCNGGIHLLPPVGGPEHPLRLA